MISIYSFVNDKISDSFVHNCCQLAKDVCLVVSDPNQYKKITRYKEKYPNLKAFSEKNLDITEGYNLALDYTSQPIKICLSTKEYIDIKYKNLWYDLAQILLQDKVDSYAIPLVSEDMDYLQSKWFIHKSNCFRGQAKCELDNYINRTDGLDLIYKDTKYMSNFKITPIDKNRLLTLEYPFVMLS